MTASPIAKHYRSNSLDSTHESGFEVITDSSRNGSRASSPKAEFLKCDSPPAPPLDAVVTPAFRGPQSDWLRETARFAIYTTASTVIAVAASQFLQSEPSCPPCPRTVDVIITPQKDSVSGCVLAATASQLSQWVDFNLSLVLGLE